MNLEDVLNLDAPKMKNKSSDTKNILSEFDKTPTFFEKSEVIKEYKKSLQENNSKDKLDNNAKKENKLKH